MEDLRRLLLLRVLVVLGPCVMLLWLRFGLTPPQPLPFLAVALFLGWGALAFVAVHPFARRRKPVTAWELFALLQLDVLALALLLFFSGGASNPFVSLLLLPPIVAAALLPAGQVWAMAAVTVALYTALMFHYQPLPGILTCYSPGFQIHLWGMWLVFAISALLIAGFVARLATALRLRDRQVAQLREQALRDEQILTLGLFAAGAAHELGTPLSTIAVLAREMEHSHGDDAELRADLGMLRQQVDACKAILGDLLRSANLTADRETTQPLDALLEQIRARWQLLRPGVPLAVRCSRVIAAACRGGPADGQPDPPHPARQRRRRQPAQREPGRALGGSAGGDRDSRPGRGFDPGSASPRRRSVLFHQGGWRRHRPAAGQRRAGTAGRPGEPVARSSGGNPHPR